MRPVNRHLLGFLDEGPRSVQDILTELGVPKSTVYSRLHDLRELSLVAVQRTVITPEGKRTDLFRSLVEEARIDLRGRMVTLTMKSRDLAGERLKTLWGDLRKEASR
jgi:predicted ArsR family transcriptional regulator